MEKNNNKIRPAHVQISILPSYSIESIQTNDAKKVIEELQTIIAQKVEELKNGSN